MRIWDHPSFGKIDIKDNVFTSVPQDERKVVIIKYPLCLLPDQKEKKGFGFQGFYQSSGINSRFQGIWFPFDGIAHNDLGYWYLVKPVQTIHSIQYQQKPFDEIPSPPHMLAIYRMSCPFFIFISGLLSDEPIFDQFLQSIKDILKPGTSQELAYYSSLYSAKVPILWEKMKQIKIDSIIDFNRYLGNALSINFLKGYQYDIHWNGTDVLDFNEVYDGKSYQFCSNNKWIAFKRPIITKYKRQTFICDFFILFNHMNTVLYPRYWSIDPHNDKSFEESIYCDKLKNDVP